MKIVVAHPHRLFAEAIGGYLSSQEGIEVVGTYTDQYEAVEATGDQRPDVICVSAAFTETVTAELVRSIKETAATTAVVVIASGNGSEELLWVLKAGASGYINYECTGEQLTTALYKAASGEIVLIGVDRNSLTAAAELKASTAPGPDHTAAMGSLTPREREVLSLLSKGFSNRQIAESLFLSEHTVRTHVQNLRAKLNVRSKFQAAVLAMQAGGAPQTVAAGFQF